jgi:hypothetical protein
LRRICVDFCGILCVGLDMKFGHLLGIVVLTKERDVASLVKRKRKDKEKEFVSGLELRLSTEQPVGKQERKK